MIGRMAIVAVAIGLAGCAGLEPAGRNAARTPRPAATAPPPRAVEAPPVQSTAPAVAPAPTPAPSQAATPPPPQQRTAPAVAPAPTPAPTQAVAPPPQQRTAPAAAPTTTPPARQQSPVAAPAVSVPTPPPPAQRTEANDDDIVVPGQIQTQIPAPAGDPRSNEERRADVRAWDRCITQVQSAFDSDPMSPQLTTPEEYCSSSLGMADRTSVPVSRRRR